MRTVPALEWLAIYTYISVRIEAAEERVAQAILQLPDEVVHPMEYRKYPEDRQSEQHAQLQLTPPQAEQQATVVQLHQVEPGNEQRQLGVAA
ncbi:hypothetical protein AWZ03_005499 [Drosophila navojoa]|uniref:Uncharacterized protein n=1 Tax=Drosophila navojoa TaxID=7232 RepID=A0A484BIL8_DRONA|nr:hypothetical protein AWZ03_005499 [Drosophila navojoa]